MEFNELKMIWDSQNHEPMYAVNEQALHNRILLKKRKAYHITNISELLSIVVYAGTACFVFGVNYSGQNGSIYMYVLSVWMLASALYLLVSRIRRQNEHQQFDRSMRGDLKHTISVAAYQVRLSRAMRWNILPIGLLTVLGISDSGKPVWIAVGLLVFFALANYAAGWEHSIYKARKRELEILQDKLENENPDHVSQ